MNMTNAELSEALAVADGRVHMCGTGSPRYQPLLEHLKALLAEQRRRAEAPQPKSLPWVPQPLWAPQPVFVPPYIVTSGTCGGWGK